MSDFVGTSGSGQPHVFDPRRRLELFDTGGIASVPARTPELLDARPSRWALAMIVVQLIYTSLAATLTVGLLVLGAVTARPALLVGGVATLMLSLFAGAFFLFALLTAVTVGFRRHSSATGPAWRRSASARS